MNPNAPAPKPVITSVENDTRDRCVDFLLHGDGTVTYREFRRDPEDEGRWTMMSDYPEPRHPTRAAATAHAQTRIRWFNDAMSNTSGLCQISRKPK